MGIWDIIGIALFALGFLCIALRLFNLVDWPWWKALLPLLLALVKQIAVAVTAGVADYFEYLQALIDRFMGGP